ncbi:uncharacterized protein N7482_006046 [Penicillium canariense]|uniref:Uncharacterized protein n=1 Tax=Penicillium canariense TaxID=189055 RepID=A0A9W9I3J0_9EURO|nr:uncharacterized protein N7482_006046 [Penicillium canariense]KAJ5167265.1 hypothetical protein N7482_006046 [Penicillium canariense]
MSPLKISVLGESSISRYPERCVLQVAIRSEGLEQEPVSKDVTLTSNELHRIFTDLSPKTPEGLASTDAPVTKFSNTLLRTWSKVPTDEHGKPLPRVYHATSSFEVIFRDFAKVGEVIGKLVKIPKVEIESVDWRLTDQTKKELGSEARKLAMRDAVQKANDFADVVDRQVVAVEITDEGHGTRSRTKQTARLSTLRTSVSDAEGNTIDLTPEDVEFTSSVDAKFESVSEA